MQNRGHGTKLLCNIKLSSELSKEYPVTGDSI